jgi:hypothetical protein
MPARAGREGEAWEEWQRKVVGGKGERPVKELVKKWRGRHVEPTVDGWYRV